RIVEQREITLTIDDKARPIDERTEVRGGDQHESREEEGAFVEPRHHLYPISPGFSGETSNPGEADRRLLESRGAVVAGFALAFRHHRDGVGPADQPIRALDAGIQPST